MNQVFSDISKKEKMLLILLLILVLALPLTVFFVRQRQEIRSRAKVADGPAKMLFNGPSQVNPGQSFSVDLYVDSGGRKVSGIQAYLSYPANLLDVTGVTINSAYFPIDLQKTFGSGNINIAAGISLLPNPTTVPSNTPAGPTNTPGPTTIPPTATPPTSPTSTPGPNEIYGSVTVNQNVDKVYMYIYDLAADNQIGERLARQEAIRSGTTLTYTYRIPNLTSQSYVLTAVARVGKIAYESNNSDCTSYATYPNFCKAQKGTRQNFTVTLPNGSAAISGQVTINNLTISPFHITLCNSATKYNGPCAYYYAESLNETQYSFPNLPSGTTFIIQARVTSTSNISYFNSPSDCNEAWPQYPNICYKTAPGVQNFNINIVSPTPAQSQSTIKQDLKR